MPNKKNTDIDLFAGCDSLSLFFYNSFWKGIYALEKSPRCFYNVFLGKYATGAELRTQEAPRHSQIGNAIPPLFGEQSGLILKQIII